MTGKERKDGNRAGEHHGILLCWLFPSLGSPKIFALFLFITIVIATASDGYIGGVASTLEKRFQLKSYEIAFLNTILDITSLATLFFVTHYGHNRHRGRVIGVLYILAAIGAFCKALPHFFYGVPKALQDKRGENSTEFLCVPQECEEDNRVSEKEQTVWIVIGSIFSSFSAATVPLAMPYIDDSVMKRSTAIYAAVIFCSYSIGGVLGFFLATFSLRFPAYPLHASEPGYPSNEPSDPNFLGAWWLGYIIIGFALLLVSPLFFMFPKSLRKTEGRKKEDAEADESDNNGEDREKKEDPELDGNIKKIQHFLWTLLESLSRLLRNPTIVLLTLSGAIQFNTYAGLQLFGAKYIEVQFYLDPAFAAILFGSLMVPSGIIGNLVGGLVTKYLGKNNLRIGYIMMFFFCLIILADPVTFFLGCDNRQVVGINMPYTDDFGREIMLNDTCNKGCECDVDYEPICVNHKQIYFSPCHAGCKMSFTNKMNKTEFSDCACVSAMNATITEGICPTFPCNTWVIYILVGLVLSCVYTMFAIPGFMLGLRCVEEQDRSLSISLENFCGKVLGSIPGPFLYGAVLDFPCEVYQQSACEGGTGNCLIYDNQTLRVSYNGLTFVIHLIVAALSVGAVYTIWKKKQKDEDLIGKNDNSMEMETKEGFDNKALKAEVSNIEV